MFGICVQAVFSVREIFSVNTVAVEKVDKRR